MYSSGTAFLFLIIFSSLSLNAQISVLDNADVDSLTFAKVRNQINNLSNDNFEKHVFKQSNTELPYRLLLPKNYNCHKKYPVVISLHNSSRIGNDNEKQLEHLAKIWIRPEIYDRYPAIVVVPQFNSRSSIYLKNKVGILTSEPSADVHLVLNLLQEIERKYSVKQPKVYLVGYSMGGSTAQNLMNMAPEKFAAIVSISAVPDLSNLEGWKDKGILLIHGEMDKDNPYVGSKTLYTELSGNKKLIFKTYSKLTHHNITIPLLLSEQIPEWLFKQKN